jgi:ABC-type dipeptide/oligopeptide/nickel transport system ATPase component
VPDPNLHGTVVSTLAQHARYALDPLLPVGRLVGDITRRWRHDDDPTPWLAAAGLNATPSVLRRLPHELSGGMATRVALAQVLARGSRFLVADEPFTGLDPVASDQVEAALRRAADQGVGILLVTHDIRRIRGDVDGIHVIENGRIVEAHDPPWTYDNVQSEAARRLARATARDREAQP